MEKKFNPEESETLKKLNNMTELEVIKRYIKRHHAHGDGLRKQFNEELNRADDKNNFIHSSVTCLADLETKKFANIQYIYDNVFKKYYSTLIDMGYQFKVNNILSDLTDLFNEDTEATLEAADLPDRVSPYVKEVVTAYSNILNDKVIEKLKNNASNNVGI